MAQRRRRVEEKPKPEAEAPKSPYAGPVELWEETKYHCKARNIIDAKRMLGLVLQSQDVIAKTRGVRGGFEIQVKKFIGRDY